MLWHGDGSEGRSSRYSGDLRQRKDKQTACGGGPRVRGATPDAEHELRRLREATALSTQADHHRTQTANWLNLVSAQLLELCSCVLERNERWAKRYFAFQPRQFPPRGT